MATIVPNPRQRDKRQSERRYRSKRATMLNRCQNINLKLK
jgi:hypothetical protein